MDPSLQDGFLKLERETKTDCKTLHVLGAFNAKRQRNSNHYRWAQLWVSKLGSSNTIRNPFSDGSMPMPEAAKWLAGENLRTRSKQRRRYDHEPVMVALARLLSREIEEESIAHFPCF